jgi:predicted dehydrogenase
MKHFDMATHGQPTLRWGVIATGMISSWFVRDITLRRDDARANHIIQAIGSSSKSKGDAFVREFLPGLSPSPEVYASYSDVYADPAVDIVYIGTPHGFHKQNCLDAIAAGKHVLCEKAFTLTAAEARQVFKAAKAKGVFVMEALRPRFFPLTRKLLEMVHEEKVIGRVHRLFCDLGLDMDIAALGPESRLKNPALGAGTLLDICIYSLTWARLLLDTGCGEASERPQIVAVQSIEHGIDVATSVLLLYPTTGGQGILTSTSKSRTPNVFLRIEGDKGFITVEGDSASIPSAFTVYPKIGDDRVTPAGKRFEFPVPGFGLHWEADAVACDIAAGRLESAVMPWAETLRVLEMMDEARRQGGARFPQDSV